jgi:hypothetical protein
MSESEKSLSLSIGLYDYNNNPIDIYCENNNEYQAYNIAIDWVGPTAYNGQLIYAEGSVDKVIGINITPKSDAKFRYGILKITVTLKDSDK